MKFSPSMWSTPNHWELGRLKDSDCFCHVNEMEQNLTFCQKSSGVFKKQIKRGKSVPSDAAKVTPRRQPLLGECVPWALAALLARPSSHRWTPVSKCTFVISQCPGRKNHLGVAEIKKKKTHLNDPEGSLGNVQKPPTGTRGMHCGSFFQESQMGRGLRRRLAQTLPSASPTPSHQPGNRRNHLLEKQKGSVCMCAHAHVSPSDSRRTVAGDDDQSNAIAAGRDMDL